MRVRARVRVRVRVCVRAWKDTKNFSCRKRTASLKEAEDVCANANARRGEEAHGGLVTRRHRLVHGGDVEVRAVAEEEQQAGCCGGRARLGEERTIVQHQTETN